MECSEEDIERPMLMLLSPLFSRSTAFIASSLRFFLLCSVSRSRRCMTRSVLPIVVIVLIPFPEVCWILVTLLLTSTSASAATAAADAGMFVCGAVDVSGSGSDGDRADPLASSSLDRRHPISIFTSKSLVL